MEISDKLAFEIYTIIIFHIIALLVLFSFSLYIYLRGKKTPLLYSYLSVVAMILLWMISKIFKTVSPTVEIRWFFIVTQYFGVNFLGFCLLVFAYTYSKERTPNRIILILWAVLPLLSFLILITNPIHMKYYSYFDFYKDSFGPLIFPVQIIHYTYLVTGTIMLSRGFTKQRSFINKKTAATLFSFIVLIPLLLNIYYILFKIDIIVWIFPFPVFDFTPIAASISLIFFMIPALKFRFFDISPVSYAKLFELMPQGIVFLRKKNTLYGGNSAFYSMFGLVEPSNIKLSEFVDRFLSLSEEEKEYFLLFISNNSNIKEFELKSNNMKLYKVSKELQSNGHILLFFSDITEISKNKLILSEQNLELNNLNKKLDAMAIKINELVIAKTKSQMAQDVHDILGHSLTVAVVTAELAADEDLESAKEKLSQINELLASSLNDIKNIFKGQERKWGQTSLTKAIEHLKNTKIQVEFATQGNTYELNNKQTETIFRLCQEAVTNSIKHSNAKTISIILRYKPNEVEIFAIDNGNGCKEISKSYGLLGIEERFKSLSGTVTFSSDGESGFVIHALLPR